MAGDSPFPCHSLHRPKALRALKTEAWAKPAGCTPRGRVGGRRAPTTGAPILRGRGHPLPRKWEQLGCWAPCQCRLRAGGLAFPPATAVGPQVEGQGASLRQVTGRAWGWGRGEAETLSSVLGASGSLEDPGPLFSLCKMEGCGAVVS